MMNPSLSAADAEEVRSVLACWDVRVFIAVQSLIGAGYALTSGTVGASVFATLACLSAPAAAFAWSVGARPRTERRLRLGVASALLLLATGGLIAKRASEHGRTPPFPSWPHLFYMVGMLILAVVMVEAARRIGTVSRGTILDSVIACTGLLVLAVHFSVVPAMADSRGTLGAVIVAFFALLNAVGVVVSCWLLLAGRSVPLGAVLLAMGCGAWFAMDLTFGLGEFSGRDRSTVLLDIGWFVPYLLLTLTCRTGFDSDLRTHHVSASRWAVVVGTAALIGPSGLLLSPVLGVPTSSVALGAATVVPMIAIMLRLIGLLRTLEYQAGHDALTGLLSRESFAEQSQILLRHGQVGAFVIIDLDGFKQINDEYGHAAGDAVLREVAVRLHLSAPAGALLSRQGGDEFAVLLPARVVPDVTPLAEALDAPFAFQAMRLPRITASFGLVTVTDDAAQDADLPLVLDRLLGTADAAMYRQKTRARSSDRSTSHQPEPQRAPGEAGQEGDRPPADPTPVAGATPASTAPASRTSETTASETTAPETRTPATTATTS
ncbi:MAG: GGDEF domain-containing protein [Actinomycetales bacterium]|nr:GGDEF domain-containing protein [Actinomycetales bacterium]